MTSPPGTREEFEKYLELKPTGPFSESSKGMLQAMEVTVSTTFQNPNAQKKGTKKK